MPANLLINLWKNTRGATMILVTVIMVAALGFTAIVVDIGTVALEKQHMQNAIDAASLAAAHDLPDTSKASATAVEYIEKNGYKASDVSIAFTDNDTVVRIKGDKQVDYVFARVLGFTGTRITPEGAAAVTTLGGPFKYAVFSGSRTVQMNFNGHSDILGSTHTNASFKANGTNQKITGACEAVGTIKVNAGADIPTQIPSARVVDMPDFSEDIRKMAEAAGQLYNGNKEFNDIIDVSSPIYVKGNVTIAANIKFRGMGCILATGDITIKGGNQYVGTNDAVCIYSKDGNITVNGAGASFCGILYAPNGNITFNGNKQSVQGRVIGNTVTVDGGFTVKSNDSDVRSIPVTYVRLIQ